MKTLICAGSVFYWNRDYCSYFRPNYHYTEPQTISVRSRDVVMFVASDVVHDCVILLHKTGVIYMSLRTFECFTNFEDFKRVQT